MMYCVTFSAEKASWTFAQPFLATAILMGIISDKPIQFAQELSLISVIGQILLTQKRLRNRSRGVKK